MSYLSDSYDAALRDIERIMRERDMLREALDYIYENEGSRDYTTVSVESFRRAREALEATEGIA